MNKMLHPSILCLALLAPIFSYANNLNTNSKKNTSPTQLIKEINQLYMSLIVDELDKTQQTNIVCTQIHTKISEYKKADPNDKTKTAGLLGTLQENIEQTRKSLHISCPKKK